MFDIIIIMKIHTSVILNPPCCLFSFKPPTPILFSITKVVKVVIIKQ